MNTAEPDTSAAALSCPKCRGAMRSYERSGVIVDQCDTCRGIFLDAGELERIAAAETAHYRTPATPGAPANAPAPAPAPAAPAQGGFLGALFGGGHHDRSRAQGYRGGHH